MTTTNTNSLASRFKTTSAARLMMALTFLGALVFTTPQLLNAQTIAQALDTPSWTWINNGWFVIYNSGYGSGWVGGSAAMTTTIGYLQTSVTGPGKIKYFTESDSCYSYCFYVDGVFTRNVTQEYGYFIDDIPSGTHTLKWACNGGLAPFGAILDDVSFTPSGFDPLATAVDNTNLVFLTGGSAPWFVETTNTYDGVDAAQSGTIMDGQESWMQTTLTGPGTLTYWWKVSSEPGYDFLEFYLDGVLQSGRISGTGDWQKQTNSIPAGSHTVKWRYMKDPDCCLEGQDAGWVDDVTYTSNVSPPSIITTNGNLGFSNGVFGFNVSGYAGQTVVIQSSTNLVDWVPLQTNVMGSSPVYFNDLQWTNFPGRFYRLRSP